MVSRRWEAGSTCTGAKITAVTKRRSMQSVCLIGPVEEGRGFGQIRLTLSIVLDWLETWRGNDCPTWQAITTAQIKFYSRFPLPSSHLSLCGPENPAPSLPISRRPVQRPARLRSSCHDLDGSLCTRAWHPTFLKRGARLHGGGGQALRARWLGKW